MHFALTQRAPDALARVHARPASSARLAQSARPKRLLLSHFMKAPAPVATPEWISLHDLEGAVADVRKLYSGPIDTTVDMQCIPVR